MLCKLCDQTTTQLKHEHDTTQWLSSRLGRDFGIGRRIIPTLRFRAGNGLEDARSKWVFGLAKLG
jgi:hypothetical protein